MSMIDKAIGLVSPKKQLERAVARKKLEVMNSGYSHHGASRTKKSLVGWLFGGGSTKEDIIDNLDTLRQRSRDLYMGGATLATGAIKTTRTNVIGTGLRLKPAVDAKFLRLSEEQANELKETIEREFALWAESVECDAARKDNFYQLQQLACLSQLQSGDVFALLPVKPRKFSVYDLRVRIIEADRCSDPPQKNGKDISGGVECDEDGQVIAYHFSNRHPLSGGGGKMEWQRVEAFGEQSGRRNVIHIMESERPEQRRGVPILAPVIEALKQVGRYTEAELMAAVVSGMFTVFIESSLPAGEPPIGESIEEEDQVDSGDANTVELGNGAVLSLAPGEKANAANPGRPNPAFDGFVIAILRQVGSALEIPYELLVKHFTASYSASRAALLEAWKMFRMRRSWLAQGFCQPIYEEWFTEAVLKGRIKAPGFFHDPLVRRAYTRAEWHGPSAGQIDPKKEAEAAKIRVEEGFSTRERETAEMTGGSFEVNHIQRVREEAMRKRDGVILKSGKGGDEKDADDDNSD
jgi:lambda family phage portal protein